jgi:hypothetical protein
MPSLDWILASGGLALVALFSAVPKDPAKSLVVWILDLIRKPPVAGAAVLMLVSFALTACSHTAPQLIQNRTERMDQQAEWLRQAKRDLLDQMDNAPLNQNQRISVQTSANVMDASAEELTTAKLLILELQNVITERDKAIQELTEDVKNIKNGVIYTTGKYVWYIIAAFLVLLFIRFLVIPIMQLYLGGGIVNPANIMRAVKP